jgi:hypothetical protein
MLYILKLYNNNNNKKMYATSLYKILDNNSLFKLFGCQFSVLVTHLSLQEKEEAEKFVVKQDAKRVPIRRVNSGPY